MSNFCSKCGTELIQEAKYCSNCGNVLSKVVLDKINTLESETKTISNSEFLTIDSGTNQPPESELRESVPIIHYILVPLNIVLPWSIVSWIGIPLTLYAKNRLGKLIDSEKYKKHFIWTNISLGIFIFYLSISIIRAIVLN
jgi:hypothetical protein